MTGRVLELARGRVVSGAVLVFLGAVFGGMGLWRLVDGDEGVDLTSARLVLEGYVPYRDFYFPQMPLLPYLYGAWMAITGPSWYSARLLSSLLAIALGMVLYRRVARVTGRPAWGALAAVLLASNGLAFVWYPVVKTVTVAALALFLAATVLEGHAGRGRHVLSGALLGLAIDARLYLVALVPVFVLAVARERERGALGRFLCGLGVLLAPNAFFIVADAQTWAFDIAGHLALEPEGSLSGALPLRVRALLVLFGITGSFGSLSFQCVLLVLSYLCFVVSTARRGQPLPLSVPIVVGLALVSLLPTSTYGHWFSVALPFLVADVVRFTARAAEALREDHDGVLRQRLGHLAAVMAGLYVLAAPVDVHSFTVGGTVSGTYPPSVAPHWRIAAVRRVSRAIDSELPSGGTTAISWWPGYLVESGARILQGLENPAALRYAAGLSPAQVERYRLVTPPQLAGHIHTRSAPLVVLGSRMGNAKAMYGDLLGRSGYLRVLTVEDVDIYRRTPAGG